MTKKLEGKVAVVTGGTAGIGLATAKRFVAEGAYVYVTGRRKAKIDAAVKEIGENVTGVAGDIAKLDDLDRLYETVKREKGRVDVVFANAGDGEFASLGEITEEHYRKTFDVNVKGTIFTVQKALPLMGEGGSIILNSSVLSTKGIPAFSAYNATKAALRSFARSWTVDLKGRGIRVNALSPGLIDTPAVRSEDGTNPFEELIVPFVPLGRIGEADEIAKAAVFLASDDSSFMTAADLCVDGGLAQI